MISKKTGFCKPSMVHLPANQQPRPDTPKKNQDWKMIDFRFWGNLGLFSGVNLLLVPGSIIYVPVVPGQAGGGSFQKEKNYIAKKEFAYRMCARRPTSAMPKSFLCLCSPSAVPWW